MSKTLALLCLALPFLMAGEYLPALILCLLALTVAAIPALLRRQYLADQQERP